MPAARHKSGKCSQQAENPLTPFEEASFFSKGLGEASCEDYVGWANLLGKLATLCPDLVAVNVDDFTHNLATVFTPEVVARIQSSLRARLLG